MLNWKQEQPDPRPGPESKLDLGDISLSVNPRVDDEQFQWLCMSFGRNSELPHEECVKNWPREALKLARVVLDRLEAKIEAEEVCEHYLTLSGTTQKGCGLNQTPMSCEGVKGRDLCSLELREPTPAEEVT